MAQTSFAVRADNLNLRITYNITTSYNDSEKATYPYGKMVVTITNLEAQYANNWGKTFYTSPDFKIGVNFNGTTNFLYAFNGGAAAPSVALQAVAGYPWSSFASTSGYSFSSQSITLKKTKWESENFNFTLNSNIQATPRFHITYISTGDQGSSEIYLSQLSFSSAAIPGGSAAQPPAKPVISGVVGVTLITKNGNKYAKSTEVFTNKVISLSNKNDKYNYYLKVHQNGVLGQQTMGLNFDKDWSQGATISVEVQAVDPSTNLSSSWSDKFVFIKNKKPTKPTGNDITVNYGISSVNNPVSGYTHWKISSGSYTQGQTVTLNTPSDPSTTTDSNLTYYFKNNDGIEDSEELVIKVIKAGKIISGTINLLNTEIYTPFGTPAPNSLYLSSFTVQPVAMIEAGCSNSIEKVEVNAGSIAQTLSNGVESKNFDLSKISGGKFNLSAKFIPKYGAAFTINYTNKTLYSGEVINPECFTLNFTSPWTGQKFFANKFNYDYLLDTTNIPSYAYRIEMVKIRYFLVRETPETTITSYGEIASLTNLESSGEHTRKFLSDDKIYPAIKVIYTNEQIQDIRYSDKKFLTQTKELIAPKNITPSAETFLVYKSSFDTNYIKYNKDTQAGTYYSIPEKGTQININFNEVYYTFVPKEDGGETLKFYLPKELISAIRKYGKDRTNDQLVGTIKIIDNFGRSKETNFNINFDFTYDYVFQQQEKKPNINIYNYFGSTVQLQEFGDSDEAYHRVLNSNEQIKLTWDAAVLNNYVAEEEGVSYYSAPKYLISIFSYNIYKEENSFKYPQNYSQVEQHTILENEYIYTAPKAIRSEPVMLSFKIEAFGTRNVDDKSGSNTLEYKDDNKILLLGRNMNPNFNIENLNVIQEEGINYITGTLTVIDYGDTRGYNSNWRNYERGFYKEAQSNDSLVNNSGYDFLQIHAFDRNFIETYGNQNLNPEHSEFASLGFVQDFKIRIDKESFEIDAASIQLGIALNIYTSNDKTSEQKLFVQSQRLFAIVNDQPEISVRKNRVGINYRTSVEENYGLIIAGPKDNSKILLKTHGILGDSIIIDLDNNSILNLVLDGGTW